MEIEYLTCNSQYAIEGGNSFILRCLLENGVDPNWTFGINQTLVLTILKSTQVTYQANLS